MITSSPDIQLIFLPPHPVPSCIPIATPHTTITITISNSNQAHLPNSPSPLPPQLPPDQQYERTKTFNIHLLPAKPRTKSPLCTTYPPKSNNYSRAMYPLPFKPHIAFPTPRLIYQLSITKKTRYMRSTISNQIVQNFSLPLVRKKLTREKYPVFEKGLLD